MSAKERVRFMQGNEAVVQAAVMAGVRFFAGYPITPASEISEGMSIELPKVGGTYLQMEDELASMAAIVGASMGGVKSMTATSGPGFSLMQENLGFASMTEIPCVVVDVMRVGPASGMPTLTSQGDVMQARWGTHGDHPIIVLSPADVREAFDLTIKAINFSERYRTPVILLSDAVVGHMREKIEIPDPSEIEVEYRKMTSSPPEEYRPYATGEDCIPEWAERGNGYRYHLCSNNHNEWGFPVDSDSTIADTLSRRLKKKIDIHQDEMTLYKTVGAEDAETVIVCYGSVTRSAKEAVRVLRAEGASVGMLQLQTLWPFPDKAVIKYAKNAKHVIVPEMNMGQIIREVNRSIGREAVGINREDGRIITPKQIIDVVKENAL